MASKEFVDLIYAATLKKKQNQKNSKLEPNCYNFQFKYYAQCLYNNNNIHVKKIASQTKYLN